LFSPHSLSTALYTLSLHDALPICRRPVVAPLEAEHARVVAQVRPDGLGRVLQHIQLRLGQAAADLPGVAALEASVDQDAGGVHLDRKSTRLNSSHVSISYAVFCLK